ncbi:CblD like pilus biogenesis initiator [Rosenbergiella nectarea]|uniref:CblD like pilus biogenesis initiator n=1 Tax=Rosenbergiella nectarea TaxID=988801 RepID=A0A1H9M9H1_9GAMM|nr:CfaE/CblD family pilus tip adhesin [Rosenbergiella nectarea]SER20400.1 CblD like pilus biogenesis initiator [Rosenbergiella nectarea]
MKETMKLYSVFFDRGRLIKISFSFLIFSFSYNVKAFDYQSTITYDLSAVPTNWTSNALLANFNVDQYRLIGCGSTTDTVNGACPVEGARGSQLPDTSPMPTWGDIRLSLQEENTLKSIVVNIKAIRTSFNCGRRYPWDLTACKLLQYNPYITLGMENSTLKNIPAGTWTGHLILYQRPWKYPSYFADTIGMIFTVKVNDEHKQIIYFPAFPTSDPHVDLNLNYRPGSGRNGGVTGSSSLDMCLYDGGASAKTVQLLFKDDSVSGLGKDSDLFSIYRDGANKNQGGNRIDYQLQVVNPMTGGHDTVSNSKIITWQNANARGIQRKVVLPGIPGVSLCLPAPLNFITPAFNYSEKSSGHYTGVLRVFYSIATN